MNKKCIYFVEGSCEKQLIDALKQQPAKLIPGKVKILNPVQRRLSKSVLLTIDPGSIVVFVYDTDKPEVEILHENIALLANLCVNIKVVHLMQVLTIEDELVRSTDVKSAPELTKSRGTSAFKSDFCRLTPQSCRTLLDRHHLNADKLWNTPSPAPYNRISRNRAIAMK